MDNYRKDGVNLTLDDAVAGMKSFPDNIFDLAICDPPYGAASCHTWNYDHANGLRGFGGNWKLNGELWDLLSKNDNFNQTFVWLSEVKRLVKPSGSLWIHSTYHNSGFVNVCCQLLGLEIINEVVWFKRNAFPNLSARRLTASHETILWAHTGKVVTITHLTRSKVAGPTHPNVEVSYEVTIPFYGYISARCWDGSACDNLYAQVSTDGETEAKIIMGSVILRDGICGSAEIFERTPVLWAHSDEKCTTCRICRYTQTWPIDSLYAYLEEVKYPTYKVIRKGEDYAEVSEKDGIGWENP